MRCKRRTWRFETMAPRSPRARLRLAAVGMTAALAWIAGARADVLHATYRVSLIGLPIGAVNLNADLTPTSYSIAGDAKLTGLAKLFTQRARRLRRQGRDRPGPCVAGEFRHHRLKLEHDAHDSHGARRQHGHRNRYLAAVPGQAGSRSAWTGRQARRRRSCRRGHPSGAGLGTDPVARRMQPHGSDLRRLHAVRH